MNPTLPLAGAPLCAYETILEQPLSPSLGWPDVRHLLSQLGDVALERTGHLKVTRNGQTLRLSPPRAQTVAEAAELAEIRHFLRSTQTPSPMAKVVKQSQTHWLASV